MILLVDSSTVHIFFSFNNLWLFFVGRVRFFVCVCVSVLCGLEGRGFCFTQLRCQQSCTNNDIVYCGVYVYFPATRLSCTSVQ